MTIFLSSLDLQPLPERPELLGFLGLRPGPRAVRRQEFRHEVQGIERAPLPEMRTEQEAREPGQPEPSFLLPLVLGGDGPGELSREQALEFTLPDDPYVGSFSPGLFEPGTARLGPGAFFPAPAAAAASYFIPAWAKIASVTRSDRSMME
jgi:hypothetical protein